MLQPWWMPRPLLAQGELDKVATLRSQNRGCRSEVLCVQLAPLAALAPGKLGTCKSLSPVRDSSGPHAQPSLRHLPERHLRTPTRRSCGGFHCRAENSLFNQIPNLEWACTVCRCQSMDSVLADKGFRIARLHGAAFLDASALSSLLAASPESRSEDMVAVARTLDWQAGLRLHEFLVMKVSPSVSDAMIALLIRAPERVQEARRGGDRIIAKGLPCSDPA
eukprot:s2806_g7.t2